MHMKPSSVLMGLSVLMCSVALSEEAGKSARVGKPTPGYYSGAIQNYKDPSQDIVAEDVDAAEFEIKEGGDLVCTNPGVQETVLIWRGDRWEWSPAAGRRIAAAWRIVGDFLLIDYRAYENDRLVGKARFFLMQRNSKEKARLNQSKR